ncbi:hypothetical protein E3T34_11705 [Cryobacterium sp. TMT1-62]|uniref:SOS response-associated peptidase n=1 Tax=Cryobacterium sp. TMT1-62 TaxID=1259240 RepID=UPI00106A6FA9|nr:hypothetical protein E3T34_11705 [Cryobacterium sp. TMT1-62]
MCGRYVVPNTTDELLSLFDATGANAADWKPSYSVAPTDPAPIVREWTRDETVQRDVDLASWELKRGWAKPGGPAPINARLESVASNGMFRSPFASQRCLVPMPGYYEWQQDGRRETALLHPRRWRCAGCGRPLCGDRGNGEGSG